MKEIVQNRNQEVFNFLLNIKYLSIYSDKDVDFIKNMNLNTYLSISDVRNIYDGFYDFCSSILKEVFGELDILESDLLKDDFGKSASFRWFVDYYMIYLLNEGGIDISKTDVFKSDENIYKKLDSMSKKDCKKCLKKWDDLDPVDMICVYYPLNSIFSMKKTNDCYKVKVFSKNGKSEPKKIIEFNDNAYKSFYDFYKFSGFPKRRIDNYKLVSIIKGAKDKNDLLKGVSEFNDSLNIPFKIEFADNNIIKNIGNILSR